MSEPLANELGLKDIARDADAWIRILAEHPKLIQRPLVLTIQRSALPAERGDSVGPWMTTANRQQSWIRTMPAQRRFKVSTTCRPT